MKAALSAETITKPINLLRSERKNESIVVPYDTVGAGRLYLGQTHYPKPRGRIGEPESGGELCEKRFHHFQDSFENYSSAQVER